MEGVLEVEAEAETTEILKGENEEKESGVEWNVVRVRGRGRWWQGRWERAIEAILQTHGVQKTKTHAEIRRVVRRDGKEGAGDGGLRWSWKEGNR